jgi:hypothetical protein
MSYFHISMHTTVILDRTYQQSYNMYMSHNLSYTQHVSFYLIGHYQGGMRYPMLENPHF